MADASRASIPATAVADELLKLTSKVLRTLEVEMADFEEAQTGKRNALRQLVDRDREAVARATEQLNDLYRVAREIADNKGRRDVLESVLRKNVEVDPDHNFDEVVARLENEMKLARGITGAMRVPDIGALLNQAAVQVDHLEARADALEANLRDADSEAASSDAQAAFDEASASLRHDLDDFSAALPLPARGWDAPEWSTWDGVAEPSELVQFGQFTDDRLGASGVPALLDVAHDAGLLFEPGRNREAVVGAAQAVVLRMLTAFAPGTARFTFMDPKGLGEAVAPFLGLVADESGVARLLTDERAIEDALVEIGEPGGTAHLHEVIVVFDHPTGLNGRAVTQLRSLTETGARRGITTIVVKDPRPGRQPAEARALPALRVVKPMKTWFGTATADGTWRVSLDALPTSDLVSRILGRADAVVAAEHATQDSVELADETSWWTGDATPHLELAIGTPNPGDTLRLDLDESSGTIVAHGPAGSGLTTLLHAIVTEACVTYGPTDVQLSMVGLGGSRDFEIYGLRRLSHARLVATSADRELAVSALDGAAAEITRRLVLFQAAGTSRGGYSAYREETGNPLPRLVVIIDGANELFAHHDRLAQHARESLARFALDGGVTGVHVVLAAHGTDGPPRVLEELSDAAITRITLSTTAPGTASIETPRHSSTGALKQTDPTDRDAVLRALRAHADSERVARSPQVVDGRAVARLEDAPLDLLRARDNGDTAHTRPRLWLGEPTTLGSPLEVVLARRAGANVLVLHEEPEVAQGLLASAVVTATLAAPGRLELHVIDFMPMEDGFGQALLPLGALASITLARRRDLPETLDRMRNLVVNRLARGRTDTPPCLFVINGLDAAHDFAPGTPVSPAGAGRLAHLEQIVSEGPGVGVHTLLWGTSLATLDRHLTRDTWRGFGLRVVGPLDGATSQTAIDSPAAASLRPHQTLLYDEFESRLVRARPYALPDAAWLANVGSTWAAAPEAAGFTLR